MPGCSDFVQKQMCVRSEGALIATISVCTHQIYKKKKFSAKSFKTNVS